MQLKIGNVTLLLRSDRELSANAQWQKFAAHTPLPADYTYVCRFCEKLPNLVPSERVRHYFDQITQQNYAITEESEDQMIIYLPQAHLPWGTQVQQLYTQLALPHVLLQKSRLLLHASYILTPSGAILFTAPSGTGKTTQAELWKKHRSAQIMNGDRAVIGLQDGVATAYGFPVSGSSDDCINHTAPLRAIVFLKQASQNTVRRLPASEALRVLINGTYLPPEYQDDLSDCLDVALSIAQAVPILELACRPDEGAVIALETVLDSKNPNA